MLRLEPIIGVADVEKSSRWYQELLGLQSQHGGDVFEILAGPTGSTVLCLHHWGSHRHPTLSDPEISTGNGLILYFRVEDTNIIWERAKRLKAKVEEEPHVNPNSHQWEFSIRDPDGYYLTVSN
ncbi:hypothetical protein GCM10028791_37200 [Echinicola sediminis]